MHKLAVKNKSYGTFVVRHQQVNNFGQTSKAETRQTRDCSLTDHFKKQDCWLSHFSCIYSAYSERHQIWPLEAKILQICQAWPENKPNTVCFMFKWSHGHTAQRGIHRHVTLTELPRQHRITFFQTTRSSEEGFSSSVCTLMFLLLSKKKKAFFLFHVKFKSW